MTILSKDWKSYVVPYGAANDVTPAPSTSSVSYSVSQYIGSAIPVIQVYPETSVASSSVTIRIATNSEVLFLKQYLYGSVIEPIQTTLFTQKLYQDLGKPLYIWSAGYYIASWFGVSGLGFYVFVGYDPANYPTQEILI